MRFRSIIYEFIQTAMSILEVLLILFPTTILTSQSLSADTVSIAKKLESVINQVILKTDSRVTLGAGSVEDEGGEQGRRYRVLPHPRRDKRCLSSRLAGEEIKRNNGITD